MRRPLFWRTLVAIALVAWLSVVGAMFLWNYVAPPSAPPLREVLQVSREVASAYRLSGADAARRAQQEFFERFGTRPFLVDGDNVDLLDGTLRPGLVSPQRNGSVLPLDEDRSGSDAAEPRVGFERGTVEGRFQTRRPVFVIYGALIAAPLILALSWPLARRLAAPVAELELTVARFGAGDFAARATQIGDDEVGRLGAAFNEMADQVHAVLTKNRQLLFDVSHELRTPLARLLLYVELMESEGVSVERMTREIDRLDELLEQILALARVEGREAIAARAPTRLDQLLTDVVDSCEVEADAAGCRLALDCAKAPTVRATPDLLLRAFENVIRNAIRHSPRDGIVSIRVRESNGVARVTVADEGPGVDQEALGKLFEPFFRVDTAQPGHGLGLAIARGAVESHGGTIAAGSGHPGLRVTVALPSHSTRSTD